MRISAFCPTILSTANPIYNTIKHLDEEEIIMDHQDDRFLDEIDD
jgi:hypothetical protein